MNCDPIARWYRWFEYLGFGGALQRRRVAFLSDVVDARRVLVLGDGDGRFLERLVGQNPAARVDAVDSSSRMLEVARGRAGERVAYRHADALTVRLEDGAYDLVVSHFFLDCFAEGEVEGLVSRIASAVGRDGRWLISEFRQPGLWARVWLACLYWFFRVTTGLRTRRLVDHRPVLERCGFRLVREERAWVGLLVSELWARS